MNYIQLIPEFWQSNKRLLTVLAIVHLVFSMLIIREIYFGLGGKQNFDLGVELAELFKQIIPLNVSDNEAKTIFPSKSFVYVLEDANLSLKIDTTKYQIRKSATGVSLIPRFDNNKSLFSLNKIRSINTNVSISKLALDQLKKLSNQADYKYTRIAGINLSGGIEGPSFALVTQDFSQLTGFFIYEQNLYQVTRTMFDKPTQITGIELDEMLGMIEFGEAAIDTDVAEQTKTTSTLNLATQSSLLSNKPNAVRIYARSCAMFANFAGKGNRLCSTELVTVFYINQAGYIATSNLLSVNDKQNFVVNAVLDQYGDDVIIMYALQNKPILVSDKGDVIKKYDQQKLVSLLNKNSGLRMQLAQKINQDKDFTLTGMETEFFIQNNTTPFNLDINGDLLNADKHQVAELVDQSEQGQNGYMLLKLVDPTDVPTARLTAVSGAASTSLYVITYPSVETDLYNFSKRDAGNQDLKIIELKQALGDDLVITDTDIQPGFAGSPLIDADGYVVGMLTYQQGGADTKAVVVDNTQLWELMLTNKIQNEIGVVGQRWNQIVDDFNAERYRDTLSGIKSIKQVGTDIPVADQLEVLATDRITAGFDKSNDLLGLRTSAFNNYTQREVVTVISSSTGVILLAIVSFLSISWIVMVRFSRESQDELQSLHQLH